MTGEILDGEFSSSSANYTTDNAGTSGGDTDRNGQYSDEDGSDKSN